jgi:hypothetical protein
MENSPKFIWGLETFLDFGKIIIGRVNQLLPKAV